MSSANESGRSLNAPRILSDLPPDGSVVTVVIRKGQQHFDYRRGEDNLF